MKPAPMDPTVFADCCGELARLFGAPLERGEVAALIENGRFDALQTLAGDPRHAIDLRGALAAARAAGDVDAATSRLNAAFCRLFLGLGPVSETQPIESAHRGDGRLFQEPAAEMRDLLRAHDLVPADGFAEPLDHLSVELSLLEQFIRLETSLVEVDEHAATASLHRRLAEWTPRFAEALGEHDGTGFYAALARILVRLLEAETSDLASAA